METMVMQRTDRVILLGLQVVLALAASLTPIRNYDYWWHLKTGSLILSQQALPRMDPFSFTAEKTPWLDYEWLSQVLMYAGHSALGPATLVVLKAVLVVALCLLLVRHTGREGHGPAGVAILVATALVGASFRFDVRPELATLLLLALIFHLVLTARDTGDLRPLVLVPILTAAGSNLHPGVILAPALLAPGVALTLVSERQGLSGRRPFARRLLLTTLATALAACANPYGYRIYSVPFELRSLLVSLPSPNLEWTHPGWADFPLFWTALVCVLLVVASGWRCVDPIATPALLLSGVLAAEHLRNIGLFFVLLPMGLARPARSIARALEQLWARSGRTVPGGVRPSLVIAAVVLIGAVPALAELPPPLAWGLGPAPGNEPRAAVDFVEREGIGQRLYNDVRFGGYLIWRRYPAHRVFVDGRNEIYPGLLREVFGSLNDSRAWQAFLDRHGIDAAFLRYSPTLEKVVRPGREGRPASVVERAFSVNHFPADTWALVYWDDDAMIVVRRSKENASVIAAHEYQAIQPEDWRYLYAGVVTGHLPLDPILEELERKVREDPACTRAGALLAAFQSLVSAPKSSPDAVSRGG
jgi:hypothetical protein